MNEKQTLWQKAKAFFKKYWGYIATFFVGIGSALLYFFGFSKRTGKRDNVITEQLEQLSDGLSRTGDGIQRVEDRHRSNEELLSRHEDRVSDIEDRHRELETSADSVTDSIQRIRGLITAERERVEKAKD